MNGEDKGIKLLTPDKEQLDNLIENKLYYYIYIKDYQLKNHQNHIFKKQMNNHIHQHIY